MTAQGIITAFEDLSVNHRSVPLDRAVAALAGWLAQRHADLSREDFAVLTTVGDALYEAALQHRVKPATFLPVR